MKLQTILFLNAAEAVFKAPNIGKDRSGNVIDRKHPYKKLTVINRLICRWLKTFHDTDEAKRYCSRFSDMAENMGRAFDRDQCVYYQPEVNNGLGGPNPDRSLNGLVRTVNPSAKRSYRERFIRMRRKRRSGQKIVQLEDRQDRRKRRSEELDLETEDLQVEPEDLALLDSECDGTESGTGASFCETSMTHMRGSSAAAYELKKYMTAAMKWSNRYIYECYGQRVHDHNTNRVVRMFDQFQNV